MHEQKHYQDLIISQSPIAMCVVNIITGSPEFGKLLYFNAEFAKLLKPPQNDPTKLDLWAMEQGKNNIRLRDRIYKMAISDQFVSKVETKFIVENSSTINLIMHLTPLKLSDKNRKELLIAIEKTDDVSEDKTLNAQSTNDKLHELEYVFSLFGHDLKNHIGSLNMLGKILDTELVDYRKNLSKFVSQNDDFQEIEPMIDKFEKIENLFKNIQISSSKAYHLLEDFLTFKSLQTGKHKLSLTMTDMQEFLTDVCEQITPEYEKKNIKLQCSFPLESAAFKADPKSLYKVFHNLLSNSLKFTPEGGEVSVKGKTSPENVVFVVEDNGVGIEEKHIPEIFNLCSISSSRGTNGEEGTGFGLLICHEIIAAHSGSIKLESKIGNGTKCIVTIPQPTKLSDLHSL